MEQDIFIYIDETDKLNASALANTFANDNTKYRAYINALGARLMTKYLASEHIDMSDVYNIHSIKKVIEEFDISDIMLKNCHIDVRVIFDEKLIFVPKTHFEYDITPDVYAVLYLPKDMSNVTFVGFIEPDEINKINANDKYYFIEKEQLKSPFDFIKYINNRDEKEEIELSDELIDDFEQNILSFIDNDIAYDVKKVLIKNLVNNKSLREKFIEYENFEQLSYKALSDPQIERMEELKDSEVKDEFDLFDGEDQIENEEACCEDEVSEDMEETSSYIEPDEEIIENTDNIEDIETPEDIENVENVEYSENIEDTEDIEDSENIEDIKDEKFSDTEIAIDEDVNLVPNDEQTADEDSKEDNIELYDNFEDLPSIEDLIQTESNENEQSGNLAELLENTDSEDEAPIEDVLEDLTGENIETLFSDEEDDNKDDDKPLFDIDPSKDEPIDDTFGEIIEDNIEGDIENLINEGIENLADGDLQPLDELIDIDIDIEKPFDNTSDESEGVLEPIDLDGLVQNDEDTQDSESSEASEEDKLEPIEDLEPIEELLSDDEPEEPQEELTEEPTEEIAQEPQEESTEELEEESTETTEDESAEEPEEISDDAQDEIISTEEDNNSTDEDVTEEEKSEDEILADALTVDNEEETEETENEEEQFDASLEEFYKSDEKMEAEENSSLNDEIDMSIAEIDKMFNENAISDDKSDMSSDEFMEEIKNVLSESENDAFTKYYDVKKEDNIFSKKPAKSKKSDGLTNKLDVLYNGLAGLNKPKVNTQDIKNSETVQKLLEQVTAFKESINANTKKITLVAALLFAVIIGLGALQFLKPKSDNNITVQNEITDIVPNTENISEEEIIETNAPDMLSPSANENTTSENTEEVKIKTPAPVVKELKTQALKPANTSNGAYMEVRKIVWDVPENLSGIIPMQNYLKSAGKSIKVSLSTDLLLANEYAYSNHVKVDLTIGKTGGVKSSKIVSGSGSTEIDNIVLQSVKDTLNAVKPPSDIISANEFKLSLIIYF